MAARIGSGGVTTNAAGVSRLQLRSVSRERADIAAAKEGNMIFSANLSNAVKGMGKHVLGAFASEALVAVINATKHDSSRAAANWNISVSGKGISADLTPYHYAESGDSWGKIGKKGSGGILKPWIVMYKQMYYGIASMPGTTVLHAEMGGRLFNALNIGGAGNYKVELYNPILGTANPRRDGWSTGAGNTYAYNAFGGETGITFIPGLENARQQIGSAAIPFIIRAQNARILAASAAGRIIKT